MPSKSRLKDFLIGAIIGVFVALPTMYSRGYFDPVPYWGVDVTRLQFDENGNIVFVADFIKDDDCKFEAMVVNGSVLGIRRNLSYMFPDAEEGDKLAGVNTLILIVNDGRPADDYEIRTRHFCKDSEDRYTVKVDRVFHRWSYRDVEQYAGK